MLRGEAMIVCGEQLRAALRQKRLPRLAQGRLAPQDQRRGLLPLNLADAQAPLKLDACAHKIRRHRREAHHVLIGLVIVLEARPGGVEAVWLVVNGLALHHKAHGLLMRFEGLHLGPGVLLLGGLRRVLLCLRLRAQVGLADAAAVRRPRSLGQHVADAGRIALLASAVVFRLSCDALGLSPALLASLPLVRQRVHDLLPPGSHVSDAVGCEDVDDVLLQGAVDGPGTRAHPLVDLVRLRG
mmetsp:Transcript_90743/g.234314  ORF Transcript_90743/g.234314 Transcript_90743/m.234314 type:complete len:241 (-) Transcript_90743:110-832(-)